MSLRRILRWPEDKELHQVSTPVGENLAGIAELVRDMAETMYASNGAGLAAVQVGVLKRVFIVDGEVAGLPENSLPMVFIDPEIVWRSRETEEADEGCLSFPGIYVPIKRPFRARTRARGLDGQIFEVEGEGLFARCMQHEYEHLDGRLISDHVGPLKRKSIRRRLEREARAATE